MKQACILDADSLGPGVDLKPLLSLPLDWKIWPTTLPEETLPRIMSASVVLTNKVPITADHFARASQLDYISVLATGTNNIDLEAAQKAGVPVSNVRNYSTDSVVQHCLGMMLALAGNLLSYQQDVQAGRWQTSPFFCYFHQPILGLAGKTLTIVGHGNQGRKFASIAKEIGMNVQILTRRDRIDDFLPTTDVLSFHCPLTAETRHLLNDGNILLLKKGALVINCARGGLVEETALISALASGHLGGAGFDVVTIEPPPADHPFMKVKHPNFILTPHVAWASIESRNRLVVETAKNLQAFLNGSLQNSVSLP